MKTRLIILLAGIMGMLQVQAQTETRGDFTLKKVNDSLYYLNDWRLPYPVYQFQTGDVDSDGREDAMTTLLLSRRRLMRLSCISY